MYTDRDWLVEKYKGDGLTSGVVAGLAGCTRRTVDRWLDKFNIPKRTRAETMGVAQGRWRDKDWLIQKYEVDELPTREVARLAGCSRKTLIKWMERLGIQRRGKSEATKLARQTGRYVFSYSEERRNAQSVLMKERMADPLKREACTKHLRGEGNPRWNGGIPIWVCESCGEVFRRYLANDQKQCHFCSRKCYGEWLSKHIRGEAHPNWNGGSSFAPYPIEWTQELKQSIRERDNSKCAVCCLPGCHVHHINYDKNICDPDNLITLCNSCHSATNANRGYWEYQLSQIVEARGRGIEIEMVGIP